MKLHHFARTGDLTAVRRLLSKRSDINQPDDQGLTPLMHAAQSPLAGTDMLRLLVESGASVNTVTDPPPPPSFPSLDTSWMDALPEEERKWLSSALAQQQQKRHPVLYFAIQGGDLEKIRYLLTAGADLHYRRTGNYDALIDATYAAMQNDRFELLPFLLEQGARVDGISSHGESAILVAARSGHFEAVRQLLYAGADIEQLQWTPLMHAVVFGTTKDVRNLLKKKPYQADRDRSKRTAFLLAVQRGGLDNMHVLLEAGASLEERGLMDETPLIIAASADHGEALTWLLERGVRINATDAEGNTALMHACMRGSVHCVSLLLNAGADADIANNYRETALQLVDDPALIRRLIEAGGDWNRINDQLRRTLAGLPPRGTTTISRQAYQTRIERRFGRSNPEIMAVSFWRAMVKSGVSAGELRWQYDRGRPGFGPPIWCYERFGKSFNMLPDGRMIEIGGEHEDAYDPDFCIYNEVVVFDGQGDFTIYGYPKEVFPPTDFHSATLLGPHIYIIGGLGYKGNRDSENTPVYKLDTRTFTIRQLHPTGHSPGRIYEHQASLVEESRIKVAGGKVIRSLDGGEDIQKNEQVFLLNLDTLEWESFEKKGAAFLAD